MTAALTVPRTARLPTALFAILLAATACLVWAYWTTLVDMSEQWAHNPQYSHGYLVPLFAGVLLWLRRESLPQSWQPSWWGAPLLAVGVLIRFTGAVYFSPWLDAISLIPVIVGAWLLIGGWPTLRWAWPALAFLAFMVPLPYRISGELAGPLQRMATVVSTFFLQTLGLPAIAEGNTILLSDGEICVVEACSGLRMMVIFFALSTAVAVLLSRPMWERLVVVLSAVPIALVCNIIRITATGMLYELVSSEAANAVFHTLAGWLMMPMALAMLGVELKLMTYLILPAAGPVPRRSPPAAKRRPTLIAPAPRRPIPRSPVPRPAPRRRRPGIEPTSA